MKVEFYQLIKAHVRQVKAGYVFDVGMCFQLGPVILGGGSPVVHGVSWEHSRGFRHLTTSLLVYESPEPRKPKYAKKCNRVLFRQNKVISAKKRHCFVKL